VNAADALGPLVIESVSAERMKLLAVVLDDPNPIHLDPEATKALGMGDRVVNQGPANFAWVLDMLHEALPGAEIRDFKVRLLANVFAGDRVIAAGRVEAVEDGRATCSVWLDVDGGARAVDGTATLMLPSD
jgi:3-hydroxybutyryl-CoA dehydratase